MAGEFMQLLASLERRQQAEANADAKMVTSLITAKNEREARSHQAQLHRKHQGDMKMMDFALREKESVLKEIDDTETLLEGLGVVIQEHQGLNDDDKTEAGNNLLKFTYDKKVSEVKDLKGKERTVVSRLNDIESETNTNENRLSSLKAHVKEFENVNKALVNFSEDLYDAESGQSLGDFKVDNGEMNAFIDMNKTDFETLAGQFGGGEDGRAEVERRLRRKFSSYTKDQMEVLNKVYAVQIQKSNILNIDARTAELGVGGEKAFKAMNKAFNDKVGEVNSTITFLGQRASYSQEQIDNDSVLQYFQGDTVPAGSGITGLTASIARYQSDMAGIVTTFNDHEITIPSQFQNDPMAMAKWYSGQITEFNEDWKKANPDYTGTFDFEDSQGHKYVDVLDPQNQINLATNRVSGIDLKDWSPKQPVLVLNGAIDFFRRYSTVMDHYSFIQDQQSLIEKSFRIPLNINGSGLNPSTTRLDRSGKPISDSQAEQDRIDNYALIDKFSIDQNMDPAAVVKNAAQANLTVKEYIDNYGKKVDPNSMSEEEAKKLYYGGDDNIKSGTSKSAQRGQEIIKLLETINEKKETAHTMYLNQNGVQERQKIAKERTVATGSMGAEWENLHQEGSDLIKELMAIRDLSERAGASDDLDLWNFWLDDTFKGTFSERSQFKTDWDSIDLAEPSGDPAEISDIISSLDEQKHLIDSGWNVGQTKEQIDKKLDVLTGELRQHTLKEVYESKVPTDQEVIHSLDRLGLPHTDENKKLMKSQLTKKPDYEEAMIGF